MFNSFELKSYAHLQFALGLLNTFLIMTLFTVLYHYVLIPEDIAWIDALLAKLKLDHILSGVPVSLAVAGFWGWVSTVLFRFHDRIHEPYITKWRAWYDTDFILRGLCYGFSTFISPDLFEKAYQDKRVRDKLMNRLFYKFAGDYVPTQEGKRVFFYTTAWNYWSIALIDFYSLLALISMSVYCMTTSANVNPSLVLVLITLVILTRIVANRLIDQAHSITVEQIHIIKTSHAVDLSDAATNVAKELGGLLQ